jgi:hypothetical protein
MIMGAADAPAASVFATDPSAAAAAHVAQHGDR